jgi:hypothetical protein
MRDCVLRAEINESTLIATPPQEGQRQSVGQISVCRRPVQHVRCREDSISERYAFRAPMGEDRMTFCRLVIVERPKARS